MVVICPQCGAVNQIKVRRLRPVLDVICKQCGARHHIRVGTTSQDVAMVMCPYCGFNQPWTEVCAKCGADMTLARDVTTPAETADTGTRAVLSRKYKVLTITAVVMILFIFLGSIAGVFLMMKTSDAYNTAEEFIKSSEEIRGTVGSDMTFGFFPLGSIRNFGDKGVAEFRVRVKGSAGSTTVKVFLKKSKSRWNVAAATYEDQYGVKRRLVPIRQGTQS